MKSSRRHKWTVPSRPCRTAAGCVVGALLQLAQTLGVGGVDGCMHLCVLPALRIAWRAAEFRSAVSCGIGARFAALRSIAVDGGAADLGRGCVRIAGRAVAGGDILAGKTRFRSRRWPELTCSLFVRLIWSWHFVGLSWLLQRRRMNTERRFAFNCP